ncbi:hypothetical protein FAM09_16365 [Niastella caeni]|uniref:Uncharacterized protein n=1 Tax=Niastella caeni TaxID=2569763 RepID=A0A4S8HS18_9BACT|nr:hypothetical protein [Niastella caeni]THU38250.1 hypothetical protein FAM09_16365 [Niastella caeni]
MMNFFVPYLLIVLNHLPINNVPMNEFELPQTWTKDFTISYSFSGSMDGSRTELKISYDSCRYMVYQRMNAPKTGVFSMTEANRAEILKKMHELKVNTIKSKVSIYPVDDGYSEALCFGHHCISGGTSAIMSGRDNEIFSNAHTYLTDFAVKKRKKQRK